MIGEKGEKEEMSCASPSEEGMLAASLAHEVNNPLDCLLNFLYLMELEATLTEKGRQYLVLAREEARRISGITHAAMERLRKPAEAEDANVPELLRSVLEFYKSRLDLRGISVDARFCSDAHLAVYAGPLRQVFSNLLLNAADAMSTGGRMQVRVVAGHEWSEKHRRGVRVTFADNGSGIAARDLPRILEPFFTTKGSSGTGVGLSLVNDTVQKHGGALRVRSSTKGGRSGSVFTIFLPAAA